MLTRIIWIALFCMIASAIQAQDCSENLQRAQRAYGVGQLNEVEDLLKPCLGWANEQGLRDALALLAKTYLALDQLQKTEDMVVKLVDLDPNFTPSASDPPIFQEIVDRIRGKRSELTVSSVSKTPEDLREAPAAVVVITAEQIRDRGYLDLEQIFHDLPGFDVTRGNGTIYSHLYQRGYRSNSNDRMLFLIDGVEENSVWSNGAFISRQYPLSNIDRIEVIYGPASTMYGANAFLGVVNVITHDADDFEGDHQYAVKAVAGGGSWGTTYTDAMVEGQINSHIQFSLTARYYESDEYDLSGFPSWDGVPGTIDRPVNPDEAAEPDVDSQLRFSDITEDWAIYGKARFYNLDFGFMVSERREGLNSWYLDTARADARNGSLWVPKRNFIYFKYSRDIGANLGVQWFSRYKRHWLGGDTTSYNTSFTGNVGVPDSPTSFRQSSNQFRNELTLTYNPSSKFNVVAGGEIRQSNIQGDYINPIDNGVEDPDQFSNFFDHLDTGFFAQAAWTPRENLKLIGGARLDNNSISQSEGYGTVVNPRLGVIWNNSQWVVKATFAEAFKDASNFNRYATTTSRLLSNPNLSTEESRNIEITSSWRRDENLFAEVTAYRSEYSNSVGAVLVYYMEDEDGRLVPLEPQPSSPSDDIPSTLQHQNTGRIEVIGGHALVNWKTGYYDFQANFTWTDSVSQGLVDDSGISLGTDEVTVADIADYRFNLIANARPWEGWNLNFRLNHVDDRPTGPGTNIVGNSFTNIDGYTVAHGAVSWRPLESWDVQLLINNMFDESYFHPGVRSASGSFAGRIPQPERAFFFRIKYEF